MLLSLSYISILEWVTRTVPRMYVLKLILGQETDSEFVVNGSSEIEFLRDLIPGMYAPYASLRCFPVSPAGGRAAMTLRCGVSRWQMAAGRDARGAQRGRSNCFCRLQRLALETKYPLICSREAAEADAEASPARAQA